MHDELSDAHVRVEGRATPFTSAIPAGRVMSVNGAMAVGLRYDIGAPEALEAPSAEAARARVEKMCQLLLANPVIEEYRIDLEAR